MKKRFGERELGLPLTAISSMLVRVVALESALVGVRMRVHPVAVAVLVLVVDVVVVVLVVRVRMRHVAVTVLMGVWMIVGMFGHVYLLKYE